MSGIVTALVQLAAGLDHPNITTVYDFQVEDVIPYIVMEHIPDA
jgi:serine/threonine protein kinase